MYIVLDETVKYKEQLEHLLINWTFYYNNDYLIYILEKEGLR